MITGLMIALILNIIAIYGVYKNKKKLAIISLIISSLLILYPSLLTIGINIPEF